MSRTIKVIERHMIPRSTTQSIQYPKRALVAEWQKREPETISKLTLRKLRLAFAPSQSAALGKA
jgi:hypothetical protein